MLTGKTARRFAHCLLLCSLLVTLEASAQSYENATSDKDVVKNKLFPKTKKFELVGPDLGIILNESYVTTYLLHLGGTYYVSEEWGYGLDLGYAITNSDKSERQCIENFYNDPLVRVKQECALEDPTSDEELLAPTNNANMGPAYVPIREMKMLVTAYATWNPLYGKQLFARTATSYFDMFINFGGGLAMSDYYRKSTALRNGKPARVAVVNEANPGAATAAAGANPVTEKDQYGEAGRPDVESQTNVVLMGGIGQKYHFLEDFNVKVELRSYTLLGTDSGFDMFFTLWGGFGMRF
jgi:outer membrane beta-barrel protein